MDVLISLAFKPFVQASNLKTGDFLKWIYMLANINKHLKWWYRQDLNGCRNH